MSGFVDAASFTGRQTRGADVCVIGTGAGGGPVARALAEAGARVVVLEEGDHVGPERLTGRPRDMLTELYRDGGQTATFGTPPIMIPTGCAVGGTTLVNSGTCLRAPDAVRDRWSRELGLEALGAPGVLDRLYDRVEDDLGVTTVPARLAGRNADVARRGAERLGWSGRHLPRNAPGCVASGVCAFGCPSGAKRHTGIAYVEPANAAGATTLTGTRAMRVVVDGARAHGVEAMTRAGGRIHVTADRVVVAAGTLLTPLLLRASGVRSRHLGGHLSIHPATAVWGIMDEEVDMARGVPQSYGIDEFADRGLMLEGIAGPPDYLAMAVPFSGEAHRELMLSYRHVAQFGLMIADRARGRVLGRRRPIIRYRLGRAETATIAFGVRRLVELLFAAGARRVLLPLAGLPELRDGDVSPLRSRHVRASELKLMAFHPLGTARMAAARGDGVVDAHGMVHDVAGLYVADGSAVPGPLGVNPQLTIMALATRLADHLLDREETACPS